ncbi:MAG: transposase [Coriobacteriales bacterium]|nr:transposase [Coriobacteriales bacterium]
MPRTARKESASTLYHVINRGVGKQIIFEEDSDRVFFMRKLYDLLFEEDGFLLAWCLMDNHFHLLISAELASLMKLMHRLQTSYAGYYNKVHEHVGAVFGGRFKSEPVETDEYLMTVVRYIHENPLKGNICDSLDYPWSSYREYRNGSAIYIDPSLVLGVFGGRDQLLAFHNESHGDERCLEFDNASRRGLSDEEAKRLADELLGSGTVGSLKGMERRVRDSALSVLRRNRLSVRQIQRLTGISTGVIAKAR